MKQTTINNLPDGSKFKLNKSSKVWYELQAKNSRTATVTSENSGKTYDKSVKTKVWIKTN